MEFKMQPFDLKSADVNRGLAETIVWCTRYGLSKLPGTTDMKRHLNRLDEASKLMQRAYNERHRLWNKLLHRDYQKSKDYRLGAALLQEADSRSGFSLSAPLRRDSLKPVLSLREAKNGQERESVVRWVVERRTELLQSLQTRGSVSCTPGLAGGRLLLYWPEENLSDGAAECSTRGFFDIDNTPPWDTWVSFSRNTLLSWVPPQLLELAQVGIDVNPERCIQWID